MRYSLGTLPGLITRTPALAGGDDAVTLMLPVVQINQIFRADCKEVVGNILADCHRNAKRPNRLLKTMGKWCSCNQRLDPFRLRTSANSRRGSVEPFNWTQMSGNSVAWLAKMAWRLDPVSKEQLNSPGSEGKT